MRKALVWVAVWAAIGLAEPVLIQMGAKSLALDFPSPIWPTWQGSLLFGDQQRLAQGLALAPVARALGGMGETDAFSVIAPTGEVLARLNWEDLAAAVLVFFVEGESPVEVPLVCLLGEGQPRAFRVKWLVLNWQGEKLPEVGVWPDRATLTLVLPEGERTLSLAELETTFAALTYPGTYTRSSGERVTALWTGIPLGDLWGNWAAETEIEVVAADGYRMRYRYGDLQDKEGLWLLAFKQDGKYLPFNPGYFRLVKAGPGNPVFQSAASARMVTRLEVRGPYRPYALRLVGAREQVFSRWDLEAGIACPCHARAVTATHKGETHVYVGLPLWRLLAYVDDEVVPQSSGIKFDDGAFSWERAQAGYLVEIRAADGFSQVIPSAYLAGEDRFILALKVDGRFLREDEGGPLLFVWDDTVSPPAGLKRVKWVTEIVIRPAD